MLDPGPPTDDPRLVRLNELRHKSKEGRKSKSGLDKNDPTLLRATKALKQWRSGKKWRSETTAPEEMNTAFQELNAALDAFLEAHKKK